MQPTYRVQRGKAAVHLYGILECGESFLVIDGRERPSFFIRTRDAERAAKLGAADLEPTEWVTFDGQSATRVRVPLPSDAPVLRDELQRHGVVCFEADVRFAMRFLMARGLRGAITVDGGWTAGTRAGYRGVDRVYREPDLSPADFSPHLTVLSIDIETDMRADRLYSIALFGAGATEVLLWSPEGYETPEGAVGFTTEKELLEAFVERCRHIDPDVLTGWNVVDFDLRVLAKLGERHGVRLPIGRGPGTLRLRESRSPFSAHEATVPGRVVLDGIELMRNAFVRMDSYSLAAVSAEVLGEGKLIEGDDRGQQITDAFHEDRDLLVRYNLADARLVVDILDKLQLVDLAVERSRLTGLPIDRVGGAIAAFDFLYLEELGRRRIAAPSVGHTSAGEANLGGHVLEPEAGLWRRVMVFDFKSLYPSLIRTFQIDPLGHVLDPADGDDVIRAPNGAAFRREPGILPRMLDELFPRREAAKRSGDSVASHAIKILMNSFYGVLGTTACRFYQPLLAGAITAFGREILLWTKSRLEQDGFRVLYGDTDSLFVLSTAADLDAAAAEARGLVVRMNGAVAEHIAEKWGATSRLELEFEKLYSRLLLQSQRGGHGGARKRYAGLVHGAGADGAVEFTGLEVVRRDWTEMAKAVQRELYERLFRDGDVEGYLHRAVAEVRAGGHDGALVYRKALRKKLDEYTATTPPHVAA
ncbi:MAG: DNA polymerase II, partial [Acidobacteriota bacterium]